VLLAAPVGRSPACAQAAILILAFCPLMWDLGSGGKMEGRAAAADQGGCGGG
jgi:hypothetical protein